MSYKFEYNEKALKSLFDMFYNVLPHKDTTDLAFYLIDEKTWSRAYTSKWVKNHIFQCDYLNQFVHIINRHPEVNTKYVSFLNKDNVLVLSYQWKDCDDYKKLEDTLNKYQTRIQSLRYFRHGGSKLHKVLAVLPVIKLFNILPAFLLTKSLIVYIKIPWSTYVAEVERIKRITK